jgi:hypothetical protein
MNIVGSDRDVSCATSVGSDLLRSMFTRYPRATLGLLALMSMTILAWAKVGPIDAASYFIQATAAYFLSKLFTSRLPPSQNQLLDFLLRPTHWFWAQGAFLGLAATWILFSANAQAWAGLSISSLLLFYSAAKLGCYNRRCCQARISQSWGTDLPKFEAIVSGSFGAFLAIRLGLGSEGVRIFVIGSLVLLTTRISSLLLQRRAVAIEAVVNCALLSLVYVEAQASSWY